MKRGVLLAAVAVVVLGVLAAGAAFPAQAEDYSNTAAFLNLGLGARAMGMGGAAVATATDASAVYYNPALLALLTDNSVVSGYSSNWGALGYLNLAYARPNVGAALLRMATEIQGTDEFGNPTDTHGISELATLVGAGWALTPDFSIGANAKYYRQSLVNTSGSGFTADLAALYQLGDLKVGAAVRNVLGSVKYQPSGVTDPFERTFVAGASYQLDRLLLATDVEKGANTSSLFHLGAAYDLGLVELRGGLWNPSSGWAFTLGAGLRWGNITVDYAFEGHPYLKAAHRFGASLNF